MCTPGSLLLSFVRSDLTRHSIVMCISCLWLKMVLVGAKAMVMKDKVNNSGAVYDFSNLL